MSPASKTFDLTERLRAVLALDSGAPALQFEGRWHTWGEIDAASRRLADVLVAAGIGADAPIGIVMRNSPPIVAVAVSVVSNQQCIVTLSHLQPAARLAEDVRELGLAAVVADAQDWEIEGLRAAAAESRALGVSIAADLKVDVVEAVRLSRGELDRRALPGVAVQMLTSGTTGRPKRIPLRYVSLAKSFAGAERYETGADAAPRLRGGVAVLAQPLLHIGGLWMLLMNLVSGRRVALLERFAVEPWVALIRAHRPTSAALPPAGLQMVLDAQVPPEDLASLQAVTSGAAPVRPELAEQFEETYGAPVLVVYGATEFAGAVAGWTIRDHRKWRKAKRGSVGRAHPGVELRIVDEVSGESLSAGTVGLLEVRSSQLAADGDGWVRATDRANLDEDGFLYILGRADAMINRGGFKVDSGAVAALLEEHPQVAEAVVVGLPDDRLGEVPVAAVALREPDPDFDPATVLRWARERLTAYQVPVRLVALEELPRTPSSKVSQHEVRELLLADRDSNEVST